MLETICYGFIYLFEVLACLMFLENVYYRKQNIKSLFCIVYALAFAVQFGVSLFSVPILNLLTFVVCYFLITLVCYETEIKHCIFTTLILAIFMLVIEIMVVYVSNTLFNIDYNLYQDNLLVLVVQASLSKLFYFVVLYFASKIVNIKREAYESKYTIILGMLPLISAIILCCVTYIDINSSVSEEYNIILSISTVLLLLANIFVFYVYEIVQKTNYENLQLQLERQYTDISAKFYEDLSREYDNSRILIHDIKRHLNYIADKTAEGEPQEVLKYIGDVTGDFGLNNRIKYSGYQIVDAMINRYVHFCKRDGIKIEIEPLMTGLTFMLDSDVIALLGNLFDNAVEATLKTNEPRIMIGIHHAGEKITVIRVSNTCKSAPKAILGKLITSKLLNKDKHGIGTKSIMRVVEKYDGDFRWEYDKETKIFTASIFVQDTGVKK